jgi:DNA-binding NtrC family response regulator
MMNSSDPASEPTRVADEGELRAERLGALVGRAPVTRQLFAQLRRIADINSTVLIEGETGTGKRLVAREIIRHGSRGMRPRVTLECDGGPASELELRLFGYERGITSAPVGSPGALARAEHGTLVLDEIAALPLTAQARLVRTIETGMVQRIGGSYARRVDVRIVAITCEDLARRCERGLFRRDLYFCLRAFRVRVPPLSERLADLPLLVEALATDEGCPPELYRDAAFVEWLHRRRWSGNVRELRNVLQRVRVLGVQAVMNGIDEPPPSSSQRRASRQAAMSMAQARAYTARIKQR